METSLYTNPTQPAKPKLRWFKFRLRSLFILAALVAIVCSWLAVTIQNQRKQKALADAIEKLGGIVSSEPTWLGKLFRNNSLVRVTSVTLVGLSVCDDEFMHLQGLNHVLGLWLSDTNITDAGLVHLQGMSQLQVLGLRNTQVTDAGLVHLRGLSQVESLHLSNTQVTDAGLVHLQGLSQLRHLLLNDTQVTDAGLAHLQGLSQLEWLFLSNTKVTDAGLAHLQGLSQLKRLHLEGTKVTDEGVEKFQQVLPNCTIYIRWVHNRRHSCFLEDIDFYETIKDIIKGVVHKITGDKKERE